MDESEEEDDWEDEEGVVREQREEVDQMKRRNYIRQKVMRLCKVNGMGELELPNGKVLGNREYRNYYK